MKNTEQDFEDDFKGSSGISAITDMEDLEFYSEYMDVEEAMFGVQSFITWDEADGDNARYSKLIVV